MKKLLVAGLAMLGLTACQANYRYEPFLANAENFEVAQAKCQMLSGSAEQQIVAWGSPMYVATAQAANAFGNMDRVDRFMQNCMTVQGWRRVANQPKSQSVQRGEQEPAPEMRKKAVDLMAVGELAAHCRVKLKPDAQKSLRDLRSVSSRAMRYESVELGQRVYNEKVKTMGRDKACKQVADQLDGKA